MSVEKKKHVEQDVVSLSPPEKLREHGWGFALFASFGAVKRVLLLDFGIPTFGNHNICMTMTISAAIFFSPFLQATTI